MVLCKYYKFLVLPLQAECFNISRLQINNWCCHWWQNSQLYTSLCAPVPHAPGSNSHSNYATPDLVPGSARHQVPTHISGFRVITFTLSLFIVQLFKQRTAFVAFSNVSILSKTSSGSFSSSSALESFSELVSESGWDYFLGLELFETSCKFSPTTKKRSVFSAQLFISISSLLESSLGCSKPLS